MTPAACFLATSLVPGRDDDLQRVTVASWRTVGFEVISVNGAGEADAVRKTYPGVNVVSVPVTAERFARKPVPYVHDLFAALRQSCTDRNLDPARCLVGVINADIYLRPLPDLRAALSDAADGAVILGPRVDVAAMADFATFKPSGGEAFSVGYDFFMMPGNVLNDFEASAFCLGMPFWDYWLPLVALLRGRALKTLASPVALHVTHAPRWDGSVYLFFHALISYVTDLAARTRGRDTSAAGRQFDLLYDLVSHLYRGTFAKGTEPARGGTDPDPGGVAALADFYDRFQEVIVHHIKSNAVSFTVAEPR